MTPTERITRIAGALLGVCSVLLILSAGVLFYAAWTTRHEPFWVVFWGGNALLFIAYGVVCLLDVASGGAPGPFDAIYPLLKLGAILLALTGAAWPVMTVIRWERTGDLEAYGIVVGLVMLAHGIASACWLWRPRPAAAP